MDRPSYKQQLRCSKLNQVILMILAAHATARVFTETNAEKALKELRHTKLMLLVATVLQNGKAIVFSWFPGSTCMSKFWLAFYHYTQQFDVIYISFRAKKLHPVKHNENRSAGGRQSRYILEYM